MRKKLFAILMSAMMMVTFMPAMAFADVVVTYVDFVKYVDDYQNASCKLANGTTTKIATTRNFDETRGKVEVSADANARYAISGDAPTAFYYDLSCITPAINGLLNGVISAADYAVFSGKTATIGTTAHTEFEVMSPSFVKSTDADYGVWSVDHLDGYKVTVDFPEYDMYSYADQSITVTPAIEFVGNKVKVKELKDVDPSKKKDHYITFDKVDPLNPFVPDTIGTLAPMTFTVKAATASVDSPEFFFDTVSKDKAFAKKTNQTLAYDGAEHTVVMRDIPGATVSYQVLNKTTGKYEAAVDNKVVLKDATSVDFIATVELGTKGAAGYQCNDQIHYVVKVAPAMGITVQFDNELTAPTAVSEDFDPYNFMVNVFHDATKATAADKAAVAANAELIKAYFNDYYEFVKVADKNVENQINVSVKKKTLTDAEKTELAAKYKQLKANFWYLNVNEASTIAVAVTGGEIEWVKAPLTKKYYNKKGTLKKTYTFAVEAKADSKVTYTLKNGGEMIKIDKNTGKVTVKKGLKLGTYTVYVTASAGKNAKDTYALTIKMAKKK